MPFYRVNGLVVHMRGRKLPVPCEASIWIKQPDSTTKLERCAAISLYQCDGEAFGFPFKKTDKSTSRISATCDRHLCESHAHQVGKNRHLCPHHSNELNGVPTQPGLFTSLVSA